MKKAELKEILYAKLSEFLEPAGFKYQKKFDWFLRQVPGGFQTVGSGIVDYNPDFILTPVLTIRQDAVAEILMRFLTVAKGYEKALITISANYNIISSKPFFNPKVTTVEQINECAAGITRFLDEAGLPFLQQNSSVEALDKLVNQNPGVPSPYIGYSLHRAMNGVTLAKLNQNSTYDQLVLQYRSAITAVQPTEKQRFEDLVKFLATM